MCWKNCNSARRPSEMRVVLFSSMTIAWTWPRPLTHLATSAKCSSSFRGPLLSPCPGVSSRRIGRTSSLTRHCAASSFGCEVSELAPCPSLKVDVHSPSTNCRLPSRRPQNELFPVPVPPMTTTRLDVLNASSETCLFTTAMCGFSPRMLRSLAFRSCQNDDPWLLWKGITTIARYISTVNVSKNAQLIKPPPSPNTWWQSKTFWLAAQASFGVHNM